MSQWEIEGPHFGERFQLFVIIVLGESVVLAGATASATGWSGVWWPRCGCVPDPDRALVAVLRPGGQHGLERIRMRRSRSGRIGRDIDTYLHLPIVAGIVLAAVADELVIAHPRTTCTRRGRSSPLRPVLYLWA